eukprot:9711303-Lingulodinium_polyedra.AAC.1
MVDLTVLEAVAGDFALAESMLSAIRQACPEVREAIPLSTLLLVGFRQGKGHQWWYQQVLVFSALAIDNFLPTLGLPDNPVSADIRA